MIALMMLDSWLDRAFHRLRSYTYHVLLARSIQRESVRPAVRSRMERSKRIDDRKAMEFASYPPTGWSKEFLERTFSLSSIAAKRQSFKEGTRRSIDRPR